MVPPTKVKMKDLVITEHFKNKDLVCDTNAFNEANECTESFQQANIKNLDIEIKIENLEIREDIKNEDLVCETSEFNEASECTESTEPKYLLELQKVDMEDVLFNTFDDYNINYSLSAAEENSDTHNNSIGQNCLPEVFERQDNYSKNLDKTNAYYHCYTCGHKTASKLKLISHLKCPTRKNVCCRNVHTKDFHTTIKINKANIKGNKQKLVKNCNNYYKHSIKNRNKSKITKQHLSHTNSLKLNTRAHIVEKHMRLHTEEKPFSCSVCEYQCRESSNFKTHMLIHTGKKPFLCSVCEYQFGHKSSLKKHMLIHTGEKPFSCSVCKYQCSYKGNLKRHMLIHAGEKPFTCSVCEYQFRQKRHLKTHLLIHTEEKPFSCSVCKYQCSRKGNLKRHMLIHAGEKPFTCSVCLYQFRQKRHLKTHMLIHTGEKPFACSVCEYQFSRKGQLKQHILIHTGEKPFSCSVCKYQCKRKSGLKRHMKIHT